MRIISGEFKGRRFTPPAKKWPTRPTTDFAKEALFNTLINRFDFDEVNVLDLFGGTGSHSYECISRGCKEVVYVDKFGPCVDFVKKTAELLKITDRIDIKKADVFKFLNKCDKKFDYIFAGPPYPLPTIPRIPDLIFQNDLLKTNGLLIVEHDNRHIFEKHSQFVQSRNYGLAIFSHFETKNKDQAVK